MTDFNLKNFLWAVLAEVIFDATFIYLMIWFNDGYNPHASHFYSNICGNIFFFSLFLTGPLVYFILEEHRLKKNKIDNDNIYKF